MKAYIQVDKNKDIYKVNAYTAFDGFNTLGWQMFKYVDANEITDLAPEIIVVGGIGNVRKRLKNIGVPLPSIEIDYPDELQKYFGRKIWTTTFQEIMHDEQNWNVFIKPKGHTKHFNGKVFKEFKDFIGIINADENMDVWCSEVVNFVTEWRCFIRYGEILDVRYYRGAWNSTLDLSVVEAAVKDFKNAPAAYALDFGVDANGTMKLVEVNDGYSLGTYGMESIKYVKFLSARWSQMTNTEDQLRF
ncbi:MAG: ATP-grasp domain-containing protein [Chitinophagales bacterium]